MQWVRLTTQIFHACSDWICEVTKVFAHSWCKGESVYSCLCLETIFTHKMYLIFNGFYLFVKFVDVTRNYLTKKIPFLDVYGDINLVGHVIKSNKARRALWKIWSCDNQIYISIHIQKWYLICYISIWGQFKLFKTSDTAFHSRLSLWPR